MSDPIAPLPSTPPPGWYPHPAEIGTELYWDGSAWTNRSRLVDSGTGVTESNGISRPIDAAPAHFGSPEFGADPTPEPARRNNLAIASLVLGLVGMLINPFYVPSILAVVFGVRARREAKANGGPTGMATAGFVLGIVGAVSAFVVRYVFQN